MDEDRDKLSPEDKFLIGEIPNSKNHEYKEQKDPKEKTSDNHNADNKEEKQSSVVQSKENIQEKSENKNIIAPKEDSHSKIATPNTTNYDDIDKKQKENIYSDKKYSNINENKPDQKDIQELIKVAKEQIKEYLSTDYTHVLQVIKSTQGPSEFFLSDNKGYSIGSSIDDNDIVFRDPTISSHHAKLSISNGIVSILDNKSSNGVYVKAQKINKQTILEWNDVVSIGNTSFIVISKGTALDTILTATDTNTFFIETKEQQHKRLEASKQKDFDKASSQIQKKIIDRNILKMGFFISIIIFMFLFYAHNMWKLFHIEVITEEEEITDFKKHLDKILYKFPKTTYSYNKILKECIVSGHVLKNSEKTEIINDIMNLGFIKKVEASKLVVDEIMVTAFNEMLNKNQAWRSVSIEAKEPGIFLLQGKVRTQFVLDKILEYLDINFPYSNALENNVIIEDDVLQSITYALRKNGFLDVTVSMQDQTATFYGMITRPQEKDFLEFLSQIKEKLHLVFIYNYVICTSTDNLLIDITTKYHVHGYACDSLGNRSIIINDRLFKVGDFIDNMEIIKIDTHHVIMRLQNNSYVIYF